MACLGVGGIGVDRRRLEVRQVQCPELRENGARLLAGDDRASAFLHQLGRWSEAEARLADERGRRGLPAVISSIARGLIEVDRGQLDEAREHFETARGLGAQVDDGRINGLLYRGLAELALWEGRPEDAAEAVAAGLARTGDDEMRARLCSLGLRAAADVAERGRVSGRHVPDSPVAAALASTLETLDVRAQARQAPAASEVRAAVATGAAEHSRLDGRSDPRRWADATHRWQGLRFPAPAAYCRWRLAAAVLATGQRAEAVALWRDAHRAAVELGAPRLQEVIEQEAGRAAIPLAIDEGDGAGAEEPEVPFGLTARELEVLALVATGRTNRQIGEALFISEKTASVHVSRILAKLGATSRAQAAAIAAQLGLGGPAGLEPGLIHREEWASTHCRHGAPYAHREEPDPLPHRRRPPPCPSPRST